MSVISREDVGTEQADNMAIVRELVGRDGAPAIGHGNYTAELDRLHDAFADLTQDILFMIADGDTVMTRFRITGTLAGDGPAMTASGLMVHRLAGGQVVEAWIDYDRAGVARAGQLNRRVAVYKKKT
jgi:predicted ester cyclase